MNLDNLSRKPSCIINFHQKLAKVYHFRFLCYCKSNFATGASRKQFTLQFLHLLCALVFTCNRKQLCSFAFFSHLKGVFLSEERYFLCSDCLRKKRSLLSVSRKCPRDWLKGRVLFAPSLIDCNF